MHLNTWRIIRVKVSFTSTFKGFRSGTERNEQNCSFVEVFDLQRYELSTFDRETFSSKQCLCFTFKKFGYFVDRARTSVVNKISIFLNYIAFLQKKSNSKIRLLRVNLAIPSRNILYGPLFT